MKRRELIKVLGFFLAAAAVFLIPRFVSDFRAQQFAYVGIYFVALIGLNILTGITGQISLGHGAFMADRRLYDVDPDLGPGAALGSTPSRAT